MHGNIELCNLRKFCVFPQFINKKNNMFAFLLSFIITTVACILHEMLWAIFAVPILLFLLAIYPKMITPVFLGVLIALLHVSVNEEKFKSYQLPVNFWKKSIDLKVDIESVIYDKPYAQAVIVKIIDKPFNVFPEKVKMTYYHANKHFTPGERCSLRAKLKPIKGYSNPGGRDLQFVWLERGVTAQGYIVDNKLVQCEQYHTWRYYLFQYRVEVRNFIKNHLKDIEEVELILALALGEKKLTDSIKSVLQKTGTAHLLAISGLHVGLVGLFVLFLVNPLAKIFVILKWCDSTKKMSMIISLFVVIIYILVTGSAVSSQRAGWMFVISVLLFCCNQRQPNIRLLLTVMALMIFINIYVVKDIGFWLSSCMVGILIALCGYSLSGQSSWKKNIKIQWRLSMSALPLTLLFLKQGSLISPIANIIAVPVVGFGVVPALLLFDFIFLFSERLAGWCLDVAVFITAPLVWFLKWLSGFPIWFEKSINSPMAIISLSLSILLLSMPKGLWARAVGVYFLLFAFLDIPEKPTVGQAWVTWLDVGQGLSVVVQTANHVLVYDTGPQYEDFDAAYFTLVPFLKHTGVRHIDTLLISHADKDHRGGVERVLNHFSVGRMLVGEKLPDIINPQTLCNTRETWRWDDVIFQQFPVPGDWKSSNNRSCILKIIAGDHAVLLLGDLEQKGEETLIKTHVPLQANVLSVPHHGSKTSSSQALLEKVQPDYAIFSAGFLNSYHHPHPSVVARYERLQIKKLDTGQVGAIRVTLNGRDGIGIYCHRDKKC